jgi:hypothetical protein
MTLSRLEDLQLQAALLAQQLVELPRAAPADADALLRRLALALGDAHGLAPASEPLIILRLREIERLMREASTLSHEEPRRRATLLDLRRELEAFALSDRHRATGEAAGSL